MNKQETNLTFTSDSVLNDGDSITIKLTDVNGTAITNQTVNVTIKDKCNAYSYYSIVTNKNGAGNLNLNKSAGEYDVTILYGGNDKYAGSNLTQKLTIKEKEVVETESSTSSNNDPGAFYSPQSNRMFYTGDVVYSPGGEKMRHLGYNKWEPV